MEKNNVEIRKFVEKPDLFVEEIDVFIKDGDTRLHILIHDEDGGAHRAKMYNSNELVSTNWNEVIRTYHKYGSSTIEPEATLSYKWITEEDFDFFNEMLVMAESWLKQ